MRSQLLADDAGDPHRGVDAAWRDQGRRGGFQYVAEDVLDRGLAVGAGHRDDNRVEPHERVVRLVPIAALHARLGRHQQQGSGHERNRNELHRHEPDERNIRGEPRRETDRQQQHKAHSVDALGARRHRERFLCILARIAFGSRHGNAEHADCERKHPVRGRCTEDQLRNKNRHDRERQPPVESAAVQQPAQKARAVIFLLLKNVQIGQQPPRREDEKPDKRDEPGHVSNHDRRSRNSVSRCVS